MTGRLDLGTARVYLALAMMVALWSYAPRASADVSVEYHFGFESAEENAGWNFNGHAGIDTGLGYARTGIANGWIRGSEGWHAIWREFTAYTVGKNNNCQPWAHLLMSANVSDVYLSILDAATGRILSERYVIADASTGKGGRYFPWGAQSGHVDYNGQRLIFRVGFWGNGGDAWMRVDDVTISCGGDPL